MLPQWVYLPIQLEMMQRAVVVSVVLVVPVLVPMLEVGGLLVVLQIAIIVLITPSLAAGLISSEIQNGSWRLLQMTPLSATSIVIGKLLSVFRTLLLLLLATMPGYLVQLLIAPRETHRILEVVVSLLLTSLLCVIGTTAISSLCRKTASATAIAYAIILALFGGTLLVWLGRRDVRHHPQIMSDNRGCRTRRKFSGDQGDDK